MVGELGEEWLKFSTQYLHSTCFGCHSSRPQPLEFCLRFLASLLDLFGMPHRLFTAGFRLAAIEIKLLLKAGLQPLVFGLEFSLPSLPLPLVLIQPLLPILERGLALPAARRGRRSRLLGRGQLCR